jgi:hypothetical protein
MRGPPDSPPMPNMPPAAEMEGGQMSGYEPGNRLRESDADVQGMVGLQQNRLGEPPQRNPTDSIINAYGPPE